MMKSISRWLQRHVQKAINLYPTYVGAGVQVVETSDDFRYLRVEMALRFYNRNYVGTHFGGSLYSMCDPFYMLMLIKNLGDDYIVWDRAASIDFKKPGEGTVSAEFVLTGERIDEIRRLADEQYKVEPTFEVNVVDEEGDVVAHVEKVLYVRRKSR